MFSRTDRSVLGVWWWTVDRWLLGSAATLAVMGVFLVMAASPPVASRIGFDSQHFVWRHLMFLIPAVVVLLVTSTLSHRLIRIIGLLGFLGSVVLISASIIIGPEIKGATRWIPLGPFKLQPSEFAKPCFAVVTAWLLSLWREEKNFPGWMISIGGLAVLAGLLVLQPDMGMTFVVVITWSLQIFLAGMPLAIVLLLVFFVAPIFALLAYFALPHVQDRIAKFWEGGSMQAENAMRSFANGGFTGVGPGNGEIKNNLPDAHADFIFAVAGEEFGALMCLALVGIYAFIVFRGFTRAGSSESLFLILAVSGLSLQFGLQAAIHMASSVHLMPTKGMPLPMISYGGSSLLATCLTMGILLALTRRQTSTAGAGRTAGYGGAS
ncbi:MAG: cell division protein FtsW [Alphaproteobacteria bacterium]|nr:cell division protein FtsW [Alphaproteobacteria bacterium]